MTDRLRDDLQATLGGSYTLERELGGGGMSRVFVANETALDRTVVVKVIAPALAQGVSADRFSREVKLAARLQQANIVPVLAAGDANGLPYYTMPYVKGESLRARMVATPPLTTSESVSILRDVARALAYAHAEGVVHRDIKPENVLLSGSTAVVTDFGIAKAISAARTQDGAAATTLTQVGGVIGTPAYMAPEQAVGEAADHRTDLYSWGVMAYEMLAGRHPFAQHGSMQRMIAAHITEVPAPVASDVVPPALATLVMRSLEKDPSQRPASANEILAALDTASTPVPPAPALPGPAPRRSNRTAMLAAGILLAALAAWAVSRRSSPPAVAAALEKSLAVIPFETIGGDTANAYLAEGIAEDVTNALSQVPGLRLAGRRSAARFAGKDATPQEIGAALQVATVLAGTVRRAGGRIRTSAELSSTRDGHVLWQQVYERDAADVYQVQDDIARAIAGQLQVTLAATETAARGTTNVDAYDNYLKGMYLYRRRGTGLIEARAHMEQALALDSMFARGWAGLAAILLVSPYYLPVRTSQVMPPARDAAVRAVRLDSLLPDGHVALGLAHAESFEWPEAEAEFRRAIALDPEAPEPRYRLGWMLTNMGRMAEAIPELQQAKARDPLSFLIAAYLGNAEVMVGQLDAGFAEQRRGLELEPDNLPSLATLALGYSLAGLHDSAVVVAHRLVALNPSPVRVGIAAFALARAGDRGEAEAIMRRTEVLPADTWTRSAALAFGYLGLGDTTRALAAMERAAATDGDLLIGSSQVFRAAPPGPRMDAVMQRFHLDRARFAPLDSQ